MRLGIIGAMPQEIDRIRREMITDTACRIAGRTYHSGRFAGVESVVVFSHWGKVAAAMTATVLIERFQVDTVLFTGVAGAVSPSLRIGDIVIADRLIQHDFDVSAVGIADRFEIPLLGISYFAVPPYLVAAAMSAAQTYLDSVPAHGNAAPGTEVAPIGGNRCLTGIIASGDQFIAHPEQLAELRSAIPDLLCVEMEGAAIAQVGHEYGVPVLVIRTISDNADHSAPVDFMTFIEGTASEASYGVLQHLVPVLVNAGQNSLNG